MLNIRQETWKEVVDLYFEIPQKYKKFSLQLYPFYRQENKNILLSNYFYHNVIKNGYFIQDNAIMQIGDNFMQKKDGTFRDVQLLSPVLFLLLETMGLEVFKHYENNEKRSIETFYAGDYTESSVHYFKNYQKFYKRVNTLSEDFDYYIKIDLKNFFPSINLNMLFNQIAEKSKHFKETDYYLMREFLLFLGKGRYPIVENSTALSYLATEIYLEKSDLRLVEKLEKQMWIEEWQAVRFVDDLYIFYNSQHSNSDQNIWELIKIYDDILFEFDLQVNMSKVSHNETSAIAKDIKQASFHDQYWEESDTDLPQSEFKEFLSSLCKEGKKSWISVKDYYITMDKTLMLEKNNMSSLELFHRVLYDKNFNHYYNQEEVKRLISELNNLQFISNDIKRLTALVLKTNTESNAKKLLNDLFYKSRNSVWTRHDLAIANAYLIQKNVEHQDLLSHVKKWDATLYNYYNLYCRKEKDTNRWSQVIFSNEKIAVEKEFRISAKTEQLYFFFLKSMQEKDWLTAYAYYKSYFDRRTAELHGYKECIKPNYLAFYKLGGLQKFYSSVEGSYEIIRSAHKSRNRVPSIHGKAELLALDSNHKELLETIKNLQYLLSEKQKELLERTN